MSQGFAVHNARVLASFATILVVWGLNYPFIQAGLSYSPPVWLASLGALTGLLTSVAILLVLRTQGQIDLRQKIAAFLIGIPGIGFFFGFWTIGETVLPAGEASVLIYTFPIWTLILSLPVLGDRPTPLKRGSSYSSEGRSSPPRIRRCSPRRPSRHDQPDRRPCRDNSPHRRRLCLRP